MTIKEAFKLAQQSNTSVNVTPMCAETADSYGFAISDSYGQAAGGILVSKKNGAIKQLDIPTLMGWLATYEPDMHEVN